MKKYLVLTLVVLVFASLMAPAAFAKDQLKVGVVIPYEIGWFSAYKQGYEMVANNENLDLVWQYHNYQPDQESTAIQNLITMGVDAINLTAATPSSAQYSVSMANDAGIPIQITESGLAEGAGKPFADMDFNWENIYKYLVDSLVKDVDGPLNVVYVSGFAGSPTVIQDIKGLKEGLAKYDNAKLATDVQYGDWATAKTLDIMKNMIQSGVKFNVAIAACQEIAEGIIQALKEENVSLDDVTIISVNGGPMDVENFKDGDLDFAISQSPFFHAMLNAENLAAYMNGKNYKKKAYSPVVWVSQDNWQEKLIPWDMDASWIPVAQNYLKTGKFDRSLRK